MRDFRIKIMGWIWAFLGPLALCAQTKAPQTSWQYATSYLSSQEGLPQNSAYAMLQDEFGFVWIATQIGIARYDGHIFTDFSFKDLGGNPKDTSSYDHFLCEQTVLIEDTVHHILWVGSCAGLFGISTETYTTWAFAPTAETPILSLALERPGKLLLGTSRGLWAAEMLPEQPEKGKLTPVLPNELSNSTVTQIQASSSRLFIGTTKGLLVFSRNAPDHSFKLIHRRSGGPVMALQIFPTRNEAWIADPTQVTIYQLPQLKKIDSIPQIGVNFIALLEHNRDTFAPALILLGTEYAGLRSVDPTNYQLNLQEDESPLLQAQGIRGNQIRSYLKARDQSIWIGTRGMGITRMVLQNETFARHFHPFQLPNRVPNNYVWSIWRRGPDSDTIWLGTEGNGLARYSIRERRPLEFYDVAPHPARNIVKAIAAHRDQLWVGGAAGLHLLNLQSASPSPLSLNPLFPQPIDLSVTTLWYEASHNRLWIGTANKGLFLLDTEAGQVQALPTRAGQLITHIGQGIADSVMVATNRGYLQFPGGQPTASLAKNHGPVFLKNEHLKCVVPGQGRTLTWAGTVGNGLIEVFQPKGEAVQTRAFLPKDGLPDPVVYGILQLPPKDKELEELFLSTNRGLSKFYPGAGIFINYSEADNLQHTEFNTGAFLRTGNTYHFGGVNGFNVFERGTPDRSPYLPPLAMAYFIADTGGKDEKILLYDSQANTPPAIELKYDYPYIEFRILSLHYQDFGKVNYKYRLYPEGNPPPGWTLLQGDPDFTLSESNGLHSAWFFPQHYVLEVWASNLMGGLGADPSGTAIGRQLRTRISVRPPYWQTWWFLLSLILIGLLIAILAVNLTRQNRELRVRNTDLQTAYNNTAALADLNEIGQKVVASLRLEENIGTIMEEIRDLRDLRSDVFAIDLLDEERQVLESRLSIEDGKRLDSYAVSLDNPDSLGVACVRLAREGGLHADGFIINDLSDRSQYPFLEGKPGVQAGHPTRATMFVPMCVGDQVLGVITVQSYAPNVYSAYHLNMLQILGAYTAIAIDHSRASEARLGAERARTRAEQEDLIKSLDIKLLRSQLSPHFIFNSLGTIQYLVSEGDPHADDYTSRLGEIMREVMMMITQTDLSLEAESRFLRRYIEAERIRFRNEYEFRWRMEIAPDLQAANTRIPPMLLQPFIENSLEHAFYPLPANGRPEIRVFFGQSGHHLVIVVQDNGVGLAHTQHKKTGQRPRKISTAMENIRRRAELINQLNKGITDQMEIRAFDLATAERSRLTLVEDWELPLFAQGARFELHIPHSFKFSPTTINK